MKSIFFDKYKFRWEITDRFGDKIPLREYNLCVLLGTNDIPTSGFNFLYHLRFLCERDFEIFSVMFEPELKTLSIDSLKFSCDSIQDAEALIEKWLSANKNITTMPLYQKIN